MLASNSSISEEPERGGRHTNELDWTRISSTWGVGFVTEISEIAISNLKFGLQLVSLQPNYSQWVLISGQWGAN